MEGLKRAGVNCLCWTLSGSVQSQAMFDHEQTKFGNQCLACSLGLFLRQAFETGICCLSGCRVKSLHT